MTDDICEPETQNVGLESISQEKIGRNTQEKRQRTLKKRRKEHTKKQKNTSENTVTHPLHRRRRK